jgi:hypothetical protein
MIVVRPTGLALSRRKRASKIMNMPAISGAKRSAAAYLWVAFRSIWRLSAEKRRALTPEPTACSDRHRAVWPSQGDQPKSPEHAYRESDVRTSDDRVAQHARLACSKARALLRLYGNALPELLGEPNEQPFGSTDVAEPIRGLVLNHFADKLRAARTEPDEQLINVVHGEHDA